MIFTRELTNIRRTFNIKCFNTKYFNITYFISYITFSLSLSLQDSLGGNAHAVMVTAVSPSSFDYEETISTLKYADRAKRVRMRVEANVTSGLLATDSSGEWSSSITCMAGRVTCVSCRIAEYHAELQNVMQNY